MNRPPVDPDVADAAPNEPDMTAYDEQHVVTYIRLLQAEGEGADWREVTRVVLHMDPEREPDRAQSAYQSHLARAKWLTEEGRHPTPGRRGVGCDRPTVMNVMPVIRCDVGVSLFLRAFPPL